MAASTPATPAAPAATAATAAPATPAAPAATDAASQAAHAFIQRWQGVQASELATAQSFVIELCELLGVPKPHPTPEQSYMFERPITFHHGDGSTSAGRVDCYKRGCFVLEAKKLKAGAHTKGFDDGLLRARSQAEAYARALPAAEGRPPFVLVLDVGTVIEVYAEFSRSGGTYTPFPDPRSHRLALADLARPEVRERLHAIWTAPERLDPARRSAQVTREVAALLAQLAHTLEQRHPPEHVAAFLTRCLFSLFAEDVGLLPTSAASPSAAPSEAEGPFMALLQKHRQRPDVLQKMLSILWADMDRGGFCAALSDDVLRFNGKLFKGAGSEGYSLRLEPSECDLLIQAARANWREVEPAIFGTLLERALHPTERHALGAHYTPRAYVERLVLPTVIEPLRAEWANAQAAALVLAQQAAELQAQPPEVQTKKDLAALDRHAAQVRALWEAARAEVRRFHHRLCTVRVLDPACGSGNFLYVTLEHLKRLEGEVLNQLHALGEQQASLGLEAETVTLRQLLGIEVNPRAAALAELVLWIGWLQWHIRSRGHAAVAEPVVHDYGNIQCRDAVLAWERQELALDAHGQPLTRWDGATYKPHPATGEPVPDEAARIPQWRYVGARAADWPEADFIVGNPPFIGNKRMREALGDGYVQALRAAWPQVPESADFVMYWWARAAALVAAGRARRMGLITTNSLTMVFNRRVVQAALDAGSHLALAIPDHPWVDSADGAAVRIAMTVLAPGAGEGRLLTVTAEQPGEHGEAQVSLTERSGCIHADLSVGANVASASKLAANAGLSVNGMMLAGRGFILDAADAQRLQAASAPLGEHLRPIVNGRDLTDTSRNMWVLDFFGMSENELRYRFPAAYQHLLERVKPERDQNNRPRLREQWWVFAEPRKTLRAALHGLPRYIATVETAKHRLFQFLSGQVIPEHKLIAIALDDAFHLGVLSSEAHGQWALAAGGTLEDRPVYSKSTCFDTFPFPDEDTGLTPALRARIAALAEQIDAHRKRVLAAPDAPRELTLTSLYNVREALRAGRALTAKEKALHTAGLVGVLHQLHTELDAAVLAAYGWADLAAGLCAAPASPPHAAATAQLLHRLVALNARRAAEEAQGTIRWLRPAFQNPAQFSEKSPIKQEQLSLGHQAVEHENEGECSVQNQSGPDTPAAEPAAAVSVQPWPATLPEQVRAVADALASSPAPLSVEQLAQRFKGKGPWKKSLPTLLQTLQALGRARPVQGEGSEALWRA